MNNRILILVTVIASIAIVALGLVIGVSPNLASSAKSEIERAAVDGQNSIYEADLARLKKQFESIDDIKAELADLQESLPADAQTAEFLRAISDAATKTGVVLNEFAQEAPVVYGQFDSGDGSGTEASASISGGTLLGIPVSQSVSSFDFGAIINFVRELQYGTRLFVITDLKLTVETVDEAPRGTLMITGYMYTLADPDAQTDAVPLPTETEAPVEPAPSDSATPAPTDTATSTP